MMMMIIFLCFDDCYMMIDDDGDVLKFCHGAGSVVFHLGGVIVVGAVGPRLSLHYSTTSSTAEGELTFHRLHFFISLDFILKSTDVT